MFKVPANATAHAMARYQNTTVRIPFGNIGQGPLPFDIPSKPKNTDIPVLKIASIAHNHQV